MKDMIEYQGYFGSVHYSHEDQIFYGKIEFIRSLVNYEGKDAKSLNRAFREAVEDYLSTCKAKGVSPETPFKGSFNVRTGTELHRKAVLYAKEHDMHLNQVVAKALETYLPGVENHS